MVAVPMRFILNADDMGHRAEVDAAIRVGLQQGWLTSVSVMATGPTFRDAVSLLAEHPGVSVGVHLDLSEHRPLTPVPSLRAWLTDGRFGPACRGATAAELPDVRDEWSAQVQAVVDTGLQPDHLDSHQHLHYQPVLLRALQSVRRRFGIVGVRGKAVARPDAGWARDRVQGVRAAAFRAQLRAGGARTTRGFGSVTLLRRLIADRRLRQGVFEVMVHPGEPALTHEIAWLQGGWMASLGGVRGAERVTWRAVAV
jgi:chitin disaccharide deacetylase